MKFSNINPASESGFLPGIFSGGGAKSIVMQISFVMLIFYCFQTNFFFGGGGKLLEGKASSQPNNVSKHRTDELFSKETLTNSCTVCHIITINMLKTSKLGLISWTKYK